MVETHTISAPEQTWEQVHQYAKTHRLSISDVTRQAWKQFFEKEKTYRTIDVIIVFLLILLCILFLMGVWVL